MPPRHKNKNVPRPVGLLSLDSYEAFLDLIKELLSSLTRREISQILGLRSASSASMFLSGKRTLTNEAIDGIAKHLRMTRDEIEYVKLLAPKSEPATTQERAKQLRDPAHDLQALQVEDFSLVSQWYHAPIFSLLAKLKRQPSLEWIQRRLRNKVSSDAILRSLVAWERLGFIKREGRKIHADENLFLHVKSPTPSSSIRRFHRAMIERALEALEEQTMEQRTIGCTMFTMDPKRTVEAGAMLERFREEFRRTFHDKDGSEVCQFNYQMFWHTDLSTT